MHPGEIALQGDAAVDADPVARRAPSRSRRSTAASAVFPAFVFWLLVLRLVLEFGRWGLVSRTKVLLTLGFVAFVIWAKDRIPRHPIVVCQLLFFAWTIQAVLTADNQFMAYTAFKAVYANTVVALAIVLVLGHGKFSAGIWAWMAVMTHGAFYALTHGGEGAGGALGDPNENAMAMGSAFAVAFCAFEHFKGWRRTVCGLLAVLFAVTVIASFSRGGFVGLAATGLYCLYSSRKKLFTVGLATLAALALLVFAPQEFFDEVESISETDQGTARARQFFWAIAFNVWQDNPIMGVGGYGLRYKLGSPDYTPDDFEVVDERQRRQLFDRNFGGRAVHSLYFELLPEQGLVGIGIWGFMVYSHFHTLRRLRQRVRQKRAPPDLVRRTDLYARGLAGAMIAYLVGGAFVSVAYYCFAWYFTAMAVALDLTVRRELAALPRGSRR